MAGEPDDEDDDDFDDDFDPIVVYMEKELEAWRAFGPVRRHASHDGLRVHYMECGQIKTEIIPR